jgi:hypothetical protein
MFNANFSSIVAYDQKKKNKRTNNYLLNITHKAKDRVRLYVLVLLILNMHMYLVVVCIEY